MINTLFIKIASAISDQQYTPKSLRLSLPKIEITDFASSIPVKYNLLLNAANYTPPLDDYVEISKVYLKPNADIDTTTLSKLLSYSFTRLSPRQKNKVPEYIRYSGILDSYNNILPQYPQIPIGKKEEIPLYWINGDIEQKNASASTIKYLECVYPMYTSTNLKGFLFESTFVDATVKDAAKKTQYYHYTNGPEQY